MGLIIRLAILASLVAGCAVAAPDSWIKAMGHFDPGRDLPAQHAALLRLHRAVGAGSALGATSQRAVVGSPGINPWLSPNTSYCTWWGINCCGTTLTRSLAICGAGPHSVSGLHLSALDLSGTLPDVFDALVDLQVLGLAFNRGAPRRMRRHARMRAGAWSRMQQQSVQPQPARAPYPTPPPPRPPHPVPPPPNTQTSSARCLPAWRSRATCGCSTSPAPP